MYLITFKKSARKELEALPILIIKSIAKAIDKLSENPRPTGSKKLVDSKEDLWRIRVGNYRILYAIEDKIKIVDIRRIADRKDVYK